MASLTGKGGGSAIRPCRGAAADRSSLMEGARYGDFDFDGIGKIEMRK
jgi:hypothetical protein